ncbi:protein kinase [Coemansia biformis]|uniref:Protein kinase n=1 Tax=Coemansia biformis TaxID=1286918 RepID=A0A9W7YGV8_9FUNG|nr:protein kinase [Coemansia biformis]
MDSTDMKLTSQLQERNAQFQAEIATLDITESDDPLDVYYRYIRWLLEVFPQAHGQQMVIKLVEAPLKLFRGQERYRNDARFVKMWVWYTEIVVDGQEAVYQFLVANKIGDSLAMLYEEYAKLLEGLGKTPKADEVYRLGIARKAQPLSRLQRRFDEFQRRVVAQTARSMTMQQQQQQPDGDEGLSAAAAPTAAGGGRRGATDENAEGGRTQQPSQRTMLGTKRSGRSVRSAAANTLPQSQRGLGPGHSDPVRPNARIAVFADPDGLHDPKAVSNAGPWRDIGTDEGRRKENVREAASWRGQRLEQRRAPGAAAAGPSASAPYAAPPPEKFTVFSDSAGEEEAEPSAASSSGGAAVAALAPRNPSLSSSSELLQTLEAGGEGGPTSTAEARVAAAAKPRKAKGEERMVMPSHLLFPAGDDVPQCAEEARAQLAQYRFDYGLWQKAEAANNAAALAAAATAATAYSDEDDEDQGIADESGFGKSRRKSVAPSSPTINTRVAQKDMLGIWNDMSDSDSDGDGVLLRSRRGTTRPDGSGGLSDSPGGRTRRAGSGSGLAVDDDYQFTMGPVTPHVMPPEQARLPPVIPTSARPNRFESFVDHSAAGGAGEAGGQAPGGGEDNPPTLVLNSMRAAKRRELQQAHTRPTPLAMRAQAPLVSASTGPAVRQRSGGKQSARGLRSIDESSEAEDGGEGEDEDGSDAHSLMRVLGPRTPHSARIPVFRDDEGGREQQQQQQQPRPLFVGRSHSASVLPRADDRAQVLESDYPPIRAPAVTRASRHDGVYHSTPARSESSVAHGARYMQTPGHTKTSTSFLASGAELTELSGFTGMSTIGGLTTMTFAAHQEPLAEEQEDDQDEEEEDEDDDEDEDGGMRGAVARTPMRKRLSMAAKDLGMITPRFPKTPPGPADALHGCGGGGGGGVDDEDDDEDEDDEEDEDDPCTENIGEFADLDSQMTELQMELGASLMSRPAPSASGRRSPLFSVFRD